MTTKPLTSPEKKRVPGFVLTHPQKEYLRALSYGPSQWFYDDTNARALTRRGLATYKKCALAWKFVITDKGREYLLVIQSQNPITKDGIEVKVGQVWRDLDKRMHNRHVKIFAVEPGKGYRRNFMVARVCACATNGRTFRDPPRPTSTLSIDRMNEHSTGWALVHNV